MSGAISVRVADAATVAALRPRLGEILVDSVAEGAGVGFLAPLDPAEAEAFWARIERAVGDGRCLLFVAELADGTLAGTVQLDVDTFPNQRHRGTVGKLLVHPALRRRGIGRALMVGLEDAARDAGRWLLTLDTAGDEARRLYEGLGWTFAGDIPCYAQNPDGSLTETSLYWKDLR